MLGFTPAEISLVISLAALALSLFSAVYTNRTYHRAAPRVKADCHIEKFILETLECSVRLTLSNTGLAEISVRSFGIQLGKTYKHVFARDVDPPIEHAGTRIKPFQDLSWVIHMEPLFLVIHQSRSNIRDNTARFYDEYANRSQRVRHSIAIAIKRRYQRVRPPQIWFLAQLGGGQVAAIRIKNYAYKQILNDILSNLDSPSYQKRLLARVRAISADQPD